MVTKDGIETEVKFRIDDPEEMVEKLKILGAKHVKSGLETNLMFGRKDVTDKKERLKLRLRSFGGDVVITRKEKPEGEPEEFKVREELKVAVDNFDNAKKLLEKMGFVPKWTYEKKKRVWMLDGADIEIVSVPVIGNFIEIETPLENMKKVIKKLGLDIKDSTKDSYRDIYRDFRKVDGLPRDDLTFSKDERMSH